MCGPELEHLRQELRDPERGGGYRRATEHAGHDRASVSGGRAVRANSPGEVLAGMRTTLGGGAGGCLGGMFRCRGQRGGYRGRLCHPAAGTTNMEELNDPVANGLFTTALATGNPAARNAIWSQIDRQVMADAVILPGVRGASPPVPRRLRSTAASPTAWQPTFSIYANSVMLLMGLAVGVDYSLFYLFRERQERAAGRDRASALQVAAATSGRSVLVSGLIVMTGMVGMLLSGMATFQSLGVWGSAAEYDSAPAMSPAIPSVYMSNAASRSHEES
jgi:hypothetical protein